MVDRVSLMRAELHLQELHRKLEETSMAIERVWHHLAKAGRPDISAINLNGLKRRIVNMQREVEDYQDLVHVWRGEIEL